MARSDSTGVLKERGVKRERDLDMSSFLSPKEFLELKEMEKSLKDLTFFSAATSSGSSKPIDKPRNEDTMDLARLPIVSKARSEVSSELNQATSSVPGLQTFYAAVFDGHGGKNVSSYVKKQLRKEFFQKYEESEGKDVEEVLTSSFLNVDKKLFKVLENAKKACPLKKKDICKCKYYLENPCRCLKVASKLTAAEGSTATVIVFKENKLHVANIGDSEAYLFDFRDIIEGNIKVQNDMTIQQLQELKTMDKSLTSVQREMKKTKLLKQFVDMYQYSKESLGVKSSITELTVSHTPLINEENEDFRRIAAIAEKVEKEKVVSGLTNGIRKGSEEGLNYVRFPGAHALNMTRAFGNFGLKSYKVEDAKLVFDSENSPVIAKPDVRTFDLSQTENRCFLVVGSDGLWNNLSKEEVNALVVKFVRKNLYKAWTEINKSERYRNSSIQRKGELTLSVLSSGVSKLLLAKAVSADRVLDDITVVVVLFSSIMTTFL